jgi:GTP cyclohydrolase I
MSQATRDAEAQCGVYAMLDAIGEDPKREGLVDTPARVVKALKEMTAGYQEDPGQILSRTFAVEYDEMVVLRDIDFTSLCEHHMLPFMGKAHVGYMPGDRVVGLSKMARLVHCYARRLQVQERLTQQVANSMQEHLGAAGVGVVVEARHECMACRGVKLPGSTMVTSAMLGSMREPAQRAEFLRLTKP